MTNPNKVRAGRLGAKRRWRDLNVPVSIGLEGLTSEQVRFVQNMVDDLRAAAERQVA